MAHSELPELPPVFKPAGVLFAFATTEEGSPRVFRFRPDRQGIESLANLVRSERVLCVVRGAEIPVARKDVIDFGAGGDDWTSVLTLET